MTDESDVSMVPTIVCELVVCQVAHEELSVCAEK
jgi:hypothetical protein